MSNRPPSRSGFQHHHLLPLSLLHRQQIAAFLEQLKPHGLDLTDRSANCLWLPAHEILSLRLGQALHRGPHPHYTDVVAGRVERIRARWVDGQPPPRPDQAVVRMLRLQRVMARILSGRGPRMLQFNRRDPMRCFNDYSYLDAAIDRIASQSLDALAPPDAGLERSIGGVIFPLEPGD